MPLPGIEAMNDLVLARIANRFRGVCGRAGIYSGGAALSPASVTLVRLMKLSANKSVLPPRPLSVCSHFSVVLSIKGSSLFSLNKQQTEAPSATARQGPHRNEYLLTKPERALFCFISKENFAFFFLLIKGVL